jgi:hypothetical protein
MMFHLPLQVANLILQLPARPFERIVDGKIQSGMALIGLRGAVDIDFPSLGKRQTDVDFIKPACAVMTAGRFQHHPACGHSTETLLKVSDVLGEGSLDLRPRFHALKFDFDRRLHDLTPICLPAMRAAHYIAISGSGLRAKAETALAADVHI